MCPPAITSHRPRGFTLLELVLAMTALALISAICYGAFHVAIRAIERGEVAVVTAQRLRVVTDLLIRQVKSAVAAVPAGRRASEDEAEDFAADPCPYFVGSTNYLSFLTAAGMRGGGGLTIATYRILPDPPRLVFEETPWPSVLPTQDGQPDTVGSVVLEGFEDARFEFLPPEPEEPWQNRWDGCDDTLDFVSLPAAVRFTIRHLPGLEVEEWSQEIPSMLASFSLENVDGDGF